MKAIILIMTLLSFIQANAQNYPRVNELSGLKVGAEAPVFEALNQHAESFSLKTALEKGPVVLIFYRGFWCPVCNKHLAHIQEGLQTIQESGATVVAVSPEKPEYLEKMADKSGASFQLLYDEDYKISDAFGVTFKPEKKELLVYNTMLGANLKETHSDDTERLPIPATYIIGTDGVIQWRQFDPDYKNRSKVDEILAALNDIR